MEYEYDVAFSFLKDDEPLAVNLADTLAERYKSFVYSKKQEEIVGTDGEETFSAVFDKRARSVVVLYRNGWGTTPWTRIEQTALQNRGLREGWDFMLFVKLDVAATMPKWLPHSYIWHDFERYGPVGAAGAISSLIQRSGGTPHIESLDQKAERVRREIAFEEKRKRFLNSDDGVNAGRASVNELIAALEERATRIAMNLKRSKVSNEASVFASAAAMMVSWRCRYSNTTDEAFLEVSYWAGHPPMWGVHYMIEPPDKLGSYRYELDLSPSEEPVWRDVDGKGQRLLAVETLADEILGTLLEKERSRGR